MDDKNRMENILLTEKGVCDLYLHGTIEASTQNIQNAFHTALNDSLKRQSDIYMKMSSKGWYQTEQADQQKIQQTKQKFAGSN